PMTTVVWTTPLGLTVVQPYRKLVKRNVATTLQSIVVNDANMPSPVNSQKQKTAFPPNYVHSLDASHMTLSAIECKKAGLVFASVHDSYWTHACDVDKMNTIIRDQFVQLHQRPIMANLKAEFEDRYKDHLMPVIGWEYVSKDKFTDGGKLKFKKARVTKKSEREQKEKEVEMELAMRHLEACGEAGAGGETEEAYATVQAYQERKEAATAETERVLRAAEDLSATLEMLDLRSIELIDPKLDLSGALHQADHIFYTLSVNQKEHERQVAELRKEYKTRIRLVKVSKATKTSKRKAKTSAKTKTKVVVPAAAAATTSDDAVQVAEDAEPATTAADAALEQDSDATTIAQDSDAAALVAETILQLEKELDAKIAEVDKKYVVEFKMTPIMLNHTTSAELLKQTNEMITRGELAGHLVKRVSWVDIEFDPLPEPGDFDIGEVMDSPYFFS
ncbi:DNA-directed RNA polymerase, partial [Coemansia furcata]